MAPPPADTLERPTEAAPAEASAPVRTQPEKPVFAAEDDKRPRALKLFGRFAAGLVGLWLIALVAGSFGFGEVPGIQLPQIVGTDEKSDSATVERRSKPSKASTRKLPASLTGTPGSAARRAAAQRAARAGDSRPASAGPRRGSTTVGGPSSGGGTRPTGGNTSNGNGNGNAGGGATSQAPASAPAADANPTGTTAPATAEPAPQSQAPTTPPGSSSETPGSRSQAGTAPGRENSTATPTPGGGNANNGRGRQTDG